MPDWRDLAAFVDDVVDSVWAEPVTLIPMIPGSAGTDPSPDTSRQGMTVLAVFMQPGAEIVGESGQAFAYGGAARQVLQNHWLSICDNQLVDLSLWHQFDRVYLPWRDQTYEINFPSPSATKRPQIFLTTVQKVDV